MAALPIAPIALPSALLPTPKEDPDTNSLKSILARIYDERGHFRHITEASLQAEIDAEEDQDNSEDTDDEDDAVVDADDSGSKGRRDQLLAVRAEMIALVACVCSSSS